MVKEIGILMSISSLDNEYSIGSFGQSARNFIDFLYLNGFTWWQILPLCLPDEFNSPYNSASIYSINPFFIDLELLYIEGLITYDELISEKTPNQGRCNYSKLKKTRYPLLYKAYTRSNENAIANEFVINNPHIKEFCEFQAYVNTNTRYLTITQGNSVSNEDLFGFWAFTQYKANKQLRDLIVYAKQHSVKLMGDLPLYSSINSSEFHYHSQYYLIDTDKKPLFFSGARPDGFSSVGQCWGHPVYDWAKIKRDNYKFWIDRLSYMSDIYDGIRLDHFRGFEKYWAIPAQSRNPLEGHFMQGPGKDLFISTKKYLENKVVVGEDLGVTTPEVQNLIDDCGFYSMRVLQYGLDDNAQNNLPMYYSGNSIAYTGTHDTTTLLGYINSLNSYSKNKFKNATKIMANEPLYEGILRVMCESDARIVFFPIQDIFKLDKEFVLNTHIPSANNWSFRLNHQFYFKNFHIRRS